MKSSRNVSIILNTLIILFEIIGITIYVLNNPYFDLVYYTHDSNLLALITSTIYLFFILRKKELPKWASLLKYTSTLALTITFLIVLFVLIPMDHFNFEFYLFNKAMLYFHLICPILALISFLFFEKHKISGLKDNIRALYYTVIYTIVLLSTFSTNETIMVIRSNMFKTDQGLGYGFSSAIAWVYSIIVLLFLGIAALLFKNKKDKKAAVLYANRKR